MSAARGQNKKSNINLRPPACHAGSLENEEMNESLELEYKVVPLSICVQAIARSMSLARALMF